MLMATVLLNSFAAGTASAQPIPEWRTTVGGSSDELAHAVAIADDGGYLIAGETSSFGAGLQDGWLVKLDATGEQEWEKTFGGSAGDIFYDIQKTFDGGYILAGETHSNIEASFSRSDYWLVKTNSDGEVEWERSFSGIEQSDHSTTEYTSDVALSVGQTRDGGYVLAGSSEGSTGIRVWLLRTGPQGRLFWGRNPGVASRAVAYDVVQTPDRGFAIAGSSTSVNSGTEAILIKTDSEGNTEWTKTFGDQFNDEARSLLLTSDGGFAMGGFSSSFGSGLSDYWLIKTDSDGRREWHRSFGGVDRDSAHALIQSSDGGFALAGQSESFSSGSRFWVIKTDSSGILRWSRAYPQTSSALGSAAGVAPAGARAIKQTEDLGFLVAGWTGRVNGARNILAIKTEPIVDWPAAREGAVMTLNNTGIVPISFASVALGKGESASEVGPFRFWHDGQIVNRGNPLSAGEEACTQPIPELLTDTQLRWDQFGSFDRLHLNALTNLYEEQAFPTDRETITFEFESGESEISGSVEIVSEPSCVQSERQLPEGPSAPTGLGATVSEVDGGIINLDWDDSPVSDVTGYAVYFSRTREGPFQRIAWMAQDSGHSDLRAGDGGPHYYGISAINVRGLESPMSSVAEFRPPDITPADPPTGLHLVSEDRVAGRAQLEWHPTRGDAIGGYRVYRQDGNGPNVPISAGLVFRETYQDWTLPTESVSTYSVTSVDLAGNESDHSNIAPVPLDFFGTVSQVRPNSTGGHLVVDTLRGRVDIAVASDTEIIIHDQTNTVLEDLRVGDRVAASLRPDRSTAKQVHLVPGAARIRQFSGLVEEVRESEVVIRPSGEDSKQQVVPLSKGVLLTPHRGATRLAAGSTIVVSHTPQRQGLSIQPSEIIIVPTPGLYDEWDYGELISATSNEAVVRGTLEGISKLNGNVIVSSTELSLDVNTVIEAGFSVGDAIFAVAVLQDDGTLLARRVGPNDSASDIAVKTTLDGLYQELNPDMGNWLVSGSQVSTDRLTKVELLPQSGQRVEVSAILREDGTLYARDIQTHADIEDSEGDHAVEISGTFLEITSEGAWDIGGVLVNVNGQTELSGRPSLGNRLSVVANYSEGNLLATKIYDTPTLLEQPVRTVNVYGVVETKEGDDFLVVDGLTVSLSAFTRTSGDFEEGSTVNVQAEMDSERVLTAREIREATPEDQSLEARSSPVDIAGRVDRLQPDGGFLVNGIPVNIGTLTEIDASLEVGSSVQIRGLMRRNGSVLAREIVGYGEGIADGTDARITGSISSIHPDSAGRLNSFAVGGISILVDPLTRFEVEPATGVAVEVQAIETQGEILATLVRRQPFGNYSAPPGVQMEGVVENMASGPVPLPLDITINGVTVRIAVETQIVGSLTAGAMVRTGGRISDGIFLAREVERIPIRDHQMPQLSARFRIQGPLQETNLDSEARPDRLLVSGERIIVETLSEFRDQVFVGDLVTVEGIIREGTLIATLISLAEGDDRVQDS